MTPRARCDRSERDPRSAGSGSASASPSGRRSSSSVPGEGLRRAPTSPGSSSKDQRPGDRRRSSSAARPAAQVSSIVGVGAVVQRGGRRRLGHRVSGSSASSAWRSAIFNLLPILPLDGGHIVFALAEKIRGSAASTRRFQRASTSSAHRDRGASSFLYRAPQRHRPVHRAGVRAVTPPHQRGTCRIGGGHGRRRPPGRRPVDDEHRHRGRGGHRAAGAPSWPRPGPRSSASRSTTAPAAARGAPRSATRLRDDHGVTVPLVGDFHYNGHTLLREFPDCAEALDKYRINPGNVGRGARHDENFATMIQVGDRPRPAGADRRQRRARSTRSCSTR